MSFLISFFLLIGVWTPIHRDHDNSIRQYYLCSSTAHNCQQTIASFLQGAKRSVKTFNVTYSRDEIGTSIFNIHEHISVEALLIPSPKAIDSLNFLAGNAIPSWIDTSHKVIKKFIIIDDQIVISGVFTFTGVNGTSAEAIEVDNNYTIASTYLAEFAKHKKHSWRVDVENQ